MNRPIPGSLTKMTLVCALACARHAASAQPAPPETAPTDTPAAVRNLPPISVDMNDASVVQAAAALKNASGVDFHRIIVDGPPTPDVSFTLSAKDKPLWEVYTSLARQGPLDLQPDAGGFGLFLRSGGPIMNAPRQWGAPRGDSSTPPVAVAFQQAAGPLLIRAGTKHPLGDAGTNTGPGNSSAGTPTQTADDQAHPLIMISAIVDPRLTVTPGDIKFAEAIDENGKKLPIDKVQGLSPPTRQARGPESLPRENTRLNIWTWQATLALPEGHGKTIASAKGQVVMGVESENAVLVVNNVMQKRNQPIIVGGRTFTITAFDLYEGVINVRVESSPVAPATAPSTSPGTNAAALPFTVTVLDATNKEGWSATGRDSISGHFTQFQMRDPLKLRISVTTKIEEVAVPFELKDLPLP